MKLSTLLCPWVPALTQDSDIEGLTQDSRHVKPGDLFLAYPGALHDGRLFIKEAIAAGAAGVLYDPRPSEQFNQSSLPAQCIPVERLAQRVSAIASRFYDNPGQYLKVTGVTGTNGKTTVAFLLTQAHNMLNHNAVYMGTLGEGKPFSLNKLLNTTPDPLIIQTLFNHYRQARVEHVCMEISSHALCQHRVDTIAFEQAIFTNLTQDHLDYHQTMDAYAKAKSKLFMCPSLHWAILNADSAYAPVMQAQIPATCRILTYGLAQHANVRAVSWDTQLHGTQMQVRTPWGEYTVIVPLPGLFNLYNALAIFASLLSSGYEPEHILHVMKNLQASPGRMEIVLNEPIVIVDYAHTPDALENVISTINTLKKGRLIVVFGCGGDRDKTKRPIMGEIVSKLSDVAIVTSDNPRHEDPKVIITEIVQGMSAEKPCYQIVDRENAIAKALSIAQKEDVILIAGKGHEAYQQIGDVLLPFSDQDKIKSIHSSSAKSCQCLLNGKVQEEMNGVLNFNRSS